MNPGTKRRRALAGIGVGLLLILSIELLLRWLLPAEPFGVGAPIFAADPSARFRLLPNLQFDGFTTNADGTRGPEPRADASERILILGDSMTIGLEVRDEETFCYLLNHKLPANAAVWNAGCSAYGPVEELATLRRLGKQLKPTRVIVMFFPLNDIYDCAQNESFEVVGGRLVNAELYKQTGAIPRFFKNLAAHTWSWGIPRAARKLTKSQAPPRKDGEVGIANMAHETVRALVDLKDYDHGFPESAGVVAEGWRRFPHLFESIANECRAINAKLTVVLLSLTFDYDLRLKTRVAQAWGVATESIDSTRPNALVANALQSLGIETVDLSPDYRDCGRGAELHFAQDFHFSPAGHAVTASALAARVPWAHR
ncbi:MAG: hypothetical protein HY286_07130 [Planctomycetes bacterium]|nr:hypothetical protein [Planctomycetota bacterium]